MADNLRSATAVGQNPTFATIVSKEEKILGDKAVGGMDDDQDHVGNVTGGLKSQSATQIPSDKAKDEAGQKLKVLEGK